MKTLTDIEKFINVIGVKEELDINILVTDWEEDPYNASVSLRYKEHEGDLKETVLMYVGKELFNILTSFEIIAIICHELGHMYHSLDLTLHEREYYADLKAIELGASTKALLSGLRKLYVNHAYENMYINSENHPSLLMRSINLRVSKQI